MSLMVRAILFLFVLLAVPFQDGAKQLIDNQRVTVWEVSSDQGKTAVLQQHKYDMAGVDLSKSNKVIWLPKGTTRTEEALQHAILIDLKDISVSPLENRTRYPLAFPRAGAKKLLENRRLTVWDYAWTPNKPTPMHFHDKDVVVVYLADGELDSTTPEHKTDANQISYGLTRFNARNRIHSEELVKGSARAIIFELK